jgi:hypothetical protein
MCGYRRAKNLRDLMVRAQTPYKGGDELADPDHVKAVTATPVETPVMTNQIGILKQSSITNFFSTTVRLNAAPSPSTSLTMLSSKSNTNLPRHQNNKTRGFSFCNRKDCRYCPLLNKTGKITCCYTKQEHQCMRKISCRSSNLVYAITCKRCGMQYVGQTMLRIKDRFVHHLRDIETNASDKSVGKHFSDSSHNGHKDLQISVLEFISKPPRSTQAIGIRLRVEKHWTHVLRSLAPIGLNIENPKEYKSHKKQ